jgi:prepilin-type N-terminal cleavage/methylation domain-containing protein
MRAFIKKLSHIRKDQGGFSLVELLFAIAISSIITAGLVMTIFQLYNGHAQTSGEMNVVRQVQQAGYYISRDAQMAVEVSALDDPGTDDLELVTLTWYRYEFDPEHPDRRGKGYRAIYRLTPEGRLYRDYYEAPDVEGDTPDSAFEPKLYTTFVAEYIDIDEEKTKCVWNGTNLTLTVTASVEGIAGKQEETRIYEAKPRPNIFW